VTLAEFRRDLWHQKTRVPELSIVWRCLHNPKFSRLTEHRLLSDRQKERQTDRRTDGQTITASIALA